jgi:rubredoxin
MTVEPVRQRKGRWGGEGREMQRLGQKKFENLKKEHEVPLCTVSKTKRIFYQE